MKKFLIGSIVLILLLLLGFALESMPKLVSTKYENVEVNITDQYYRSSYTTPVRSGKVFTSIYHPAVYRITVEYRGAEYTIDDENTYKKYKDMVGQSANGTLEIRTYDNGSVKYDITELQ